MKILNKTADAEAAQDVPGRRTAALALRMRCTQVCECVCVYVCGTVFQLQFHSTCCHCNMPASSLFFCECVCVCVCVASHASSSFHSTCQPLSAMQNGHQATNELPHCQCKRLPCTRLAISDNNTHLFSWLPPPKHALLRVTEVMHCRVLLLYHL